MHKHSRLEMLFRSSSKELDRLARRAEELRLAAGSISIRDRESELATIVIESHNTWTISCKWYLISCMIGTRSVQGKRIVCGQFANDENAAIGLAIQAAGRQALPNTRGVYQRRSEPNWQVPKEFMDLAKQLPLSNSKEIDNAFSFLFSVFNNLPVFRNYFAHRNRESRQAALALSSQLQVARASAPSELLLSVPRGKSNGLLEQWIGELRFTLEFLCD